MNFHDLEAFVAVAESGSIVAASARLHLTQPAVTRRIQNLEESLGVELLDRNSKPPRPTISGRTAYELARRVLAATHDLRHAVSPAGDSTGEFRLGVAQSLGDHALVYSVGRLRASYPKLRLHAVTAWSSILLKELQSGVIDTAVVMIPDGMSIPDGLAATRLGTQTGVVVAGQQCPLKANATLAEISTQPWVLHQDGCMFRNFVRDALNSAHLPFETAVEAAGIELQLSLVAQGMGLGLVTTRMLARSRYRRSLRTIAVKGFKLKATVWLLCHSKLGRLAAPQLCFQKSLAEALDLKGESEE
jgi:DNA-binding transcriptional LysR family regulator